MNKKTLTIGEVQSSLREGRTTATALAETHLAAIAAGDGEIGSFLTVTRERALAKAAQIDRLVEKGDPLPPLAGVPVGIKDVLMTAGERRALRRNQRCAPRIRWRRLPRQAQLR
jgi:aspartyl-tRNA(Asn)/glutamyl-tRNA(Gln) amidotransferase subunit A